MICPCCKQKLDKDLPAKQLSYVRVPQGKCQSFLNLLIENYPNNITMNSILLKLYSGENEPEMSTRVISVMRVKINKIVRNYGWQISNSHGRSMWEDTKYSIEKYEK